MTILFYTISVAAFAALNYAFYRLNKTEILLEDLELLDQGKITIIRSYENYNKMYKIIVPIIVLITLLSSGTNGLYGICLAPLVFTMVVLFDGGKYYTYNYEEGRITYVKRGKLMKSCTWDEVHHIFTRSLGRRYLYYIRLNDDTKFAIDASIANYKPINMEIKSGMSLTPLIIFGFYAIMAALMIILRCVFHLF